MSCNNLTLFPANIYLFNVNNGDSKKRCEICSNVTIKTPERRLVFLLLTLKKYILAGLIHKITGNITCSQSTIMKLNHGHCYGVGKFEFEQIGATWDFCYSFNFKLNKVSKNN